MTTTETPTERRDRYAAAIRQRIQDLTGPETTFPGQIRFGATEYDIADTAIALADLDAAAERAEARDLLRSETRRADTAIEREATSDAAADELRAERDQLARELAALRAATPDLGYCPECGRGDCAPGRTEWQQQYQRADRATTALREVLAAFTGIVSTPGGAPVGYYAPHVIHPDDIRRWRAALDDEQHVDVEPDLTTFLTAVRDASTAAIRTGPSMPVPDEVIADGAGWAQLMAADEAAARDTCDASIPGVFGQPIGPCILRRGHDGPVHKAASGATWRPRPLPAGIVSTNSVLTPAQAEAFRSAFPGVRIEGRIEFTHGGHTWRYQPAADADHCCVCGATDIAYRNYRDQPFCHLCANCQCGKTPCERTVTTPED